MAEVRYPFLSKNIKAIRAVYGWTQEELATILKSTVPSIKSYESGRAKPKYIVLNQLCMLAAADLQEIMEEEIPLEDILWMKNNEEATLDFKRATPEHLSSTRKQQKFSTNEQATIHETQKNEQLYLKSSLKGLGVPIKELRTHLQLTREQLGEALKIDSEKIALIEKGLIFNAEDPDIEVVHSWYKSSKNNPDIKQRFYSPNSDMAGESEIDYITLLDANPRIFEDVKKGRHAIPDIIKKYGNARMLIPGFEDCDFAIRWTGGISYMNNGDILMCKVVKKDDTWSMAKYGEMFVAVCDFGVKIAARLGPDRDNTFVYIKDGNEVEIRFEQIEALLIVKSSVNRLTY